MFETFKIAEAPNMLPNMGHRNMQAAKSQSIFQKYAIVIVLGALEALFIVLFGVFGKYQRTAMPHKVAQKNVEVGTNASISVESAPVDNAGDANYLKNFYPGMNYTFLPTYYISKKIK